MSTHRCNTASPIAPYSTASASSAGRRECCGRPKVSLSAGQQHASTEPRMLDLSAFPITKRWPAQHPDRLQLYSLPTPNGVKASIMLEETGLPYEPHTINFGTNDQITPEFMSLNPNNKIPAIL